MALPRFSSLPHHVMPHANTDICAFNDGYISSVKFCANEVNNMGHKVRKCTFGQFFEYKKSKVMMYDVSRVC